MYVLASIDQSSSSSTMSDLLKPAENRTGDIKKPGHEELWEEHRQAFEEHKKHVEEYLKDFLVKFKKDHQGNIILFSNIKFRPLHGRAATTCVNSVPRFRGSSIKATSMFYKACLESKNAKNNAPQSFFCDAPGPTVH